MGVSQSLKITQVSQSVATNTSVIRIVWKSTQTGESYNNNLRTAYYSVTVNGAATSYEVNYKLTKSTTVTILDTSMTVTHNAAGECTVVVDTYMDTAISEGEIELWESKTLDTIARSSAPTVSATSTDMGSKVQISTNRKSNSLTHDLAYSFEGGDYVTFATDVDDSYVWTVPDLASSVPNAASGTVTIRCTTKNGDDEIGTATVAMTLTVPTSVVPTISNVVIKEATTGLAQKFGAYVQHKSTLNVAITAAGAKGSTIANYKTLVANVAYTDASFTTSELTGSGLQNVIVSVTDSRGRTASKIVSVNVLAYEPPKITEFKAYRCNQDGTPNDEGIYAYVTSAHSVSSLNDKNTAEISFEYRKEADPDWTLLGGSSMVPLVGSGSGILDTTFSVDYQYRFRQTLTDWFGVPTTYTITLTSSDVILDISSDGTGLGIGKVSQRSNATEFGRPIYDRHDKRITNGLAIYTGSGDAAVDPDTTLDHTVLTDLNTPTEAFYYVCTYFYSDKTDASNKAQMAIPYNTAGDSIYYRHKYNNKWSTWQKPNDPLSAYPVDSIYISYSHTSPAALFGGTWTRIESRFLWGVPQTDTIGSTGGAQTHTLTSNEMPSHTHEFRYSTDNGSTWNGASAGRDGTIGDDNYLGMSRSVTAFASYQVKLTWVGGGAAHNNMPPYINVSIWRRTA